MGIFLFAINVPNSHRPLSAGRGQVPQSRCEVAWTPWGLFSLAKNSQGIWPRVCHGTMWSSPSSLTEGALWGRKGTIMFLVSQTEALRSKWAANMGLQL